MKKIIALVLVALMALSAVSALADGMPGPSKTAPFINRGEAEELGLIKVDPTEKLAAIIDAVTAAGADGAVAALPADVSGLIPEGYATINEMDCYQLVGDTENAKDQELIFKFATPYEEGEEVTLLIGISPAEGDVEWLVLAGKANADGDVVVTVTSEQFKKISNNPFVVIPVSK